MRSLTASSAPTNQSARPPTPASPPTDQQKWHTRLGTLLATPFPSGEDSVTIPRNTHPDIFPAINEALCMYMDPLSAPSPDG